MSIDASAVKELRGMTGAGIMDCKKALAENDGDVEKAMTFLRKKGLAAAEKKAGRETKEGLVGSYIHANGKLGVMVEVACETDFVARTDEFQALVKDICMHVAAAAPVAVTREEIPAEIAATEREMMTAQVAEMGKPEQVRDKIVEGKMEKWYGEKVLMEQGFVKDPDQKISDVVTAAVAKLGENIQIKRFSRFALGEA
ncbi:MAG: translation elongation factor Ts [Gemmatimonadetes bacterium]|nr:translation elongation factor Ts [Gemmatimonadota bacterium]